MALPAQFVDMLRGFGPAYSAPLLAALDTAPSVSVRVFATNALRATGDVNYPFYVGLVAMWSLQVFGGYMLGIYFGLGIYALWLMIASDEITRGIIFIRRWWSMKWADKSFVGKSIPS